MSARILNVAVGAVVLLSAGIAAAQAPSHRYSDHYNDDLADEAQAPSDLSDSDMYDASTPDGANVYAADPADSYVVEKPAAPRTMEPPAEADYAADVPPQPRDPVGTCREFAQDVTMYGQAQTAYGTACLQPDGAWKIMRKPEVAVSSSETFVPTPPAPAYTYREPTPVYATPAPRVYSYAQPRSTPSVAYASRAPAYAAPTYAAPAYTAPVLPRIRATLRLRSFSAWLHGARSHEPARGERRYHWRDG